MFPNSIYAAQERKKENKKIPEPREKEDNPKHEKMEKKQVNCQKDAVLVLWKFRQLLNKRPRNFEVRSKPPAKINVNVRGMYGNVQGK